MIGLWLLLSLSACSSPLGESGEANGKEKDEATNQTSEEEQQDLEDKIRLKGVSLLGRTFVDTLGAGVNYNALDSEEDLFDTYSNNFGGQEGLGYGDIYNDSLTDTNKMTSYFMALNYIAHNAALVCEKGKKKDKCACDEDSEAKAMLSRAIPYKDFSSDELKETITEFAGLCRESYVDAITALMSSIAVAKRN